MKKLLLLVFCLALFSPDGNTQNQFNGFSQYKLISGSSAVVYFRVLSDDKEKMDALNGLLLSTHGIAGSSFTEDRGNYRFKCIIGSDMTAEDMKIILNSLNLRIDPESLADKNNEPKKIIKAPLSTEQEIAPHYPTFVDTGNPQADHTAFDAAKQEWIKNYPEEVNKLRMKEKEMEKEINEKGE